MKMSEEERISLEMYSYLKAILELYDDGVVTIQYGTFSGIADLLRRHLLLRLKKTEEGESLNAVASVKLDLKEVDERWKSKPGG